MSCLTTGVLLRTPYITTKEDHTGFSSLWEPCKTTDKQTFHVFLLTER